MSAMPSASSGQTDAVYIGKMASTHDEWPALDYNYKYYSEQSLDHYTGAATGAYHNVPNVPGFIPMPDRLAQSIIEIGQLVDTVRQLQQHNIKLISTLTELQQHSYKLVIANDVLNKQLSTHVGGDATSQRLAALESRIANASYISILIDGDIMPFLDSLVTQGPKGGRLASQMLRAAAFKHAKAVGIDLSHDPKVHITVYANLDHLSRTYEQLGIVDFKEKYIAFTRGFTMGDTKDSFSTYVNASAGKERADDKINTHFKMDMSNVHCQHILFCGSGDRGYGRLLEKYIHDVQACKKITMVEGPRFESELYGIITAGNFRILKMVKCDDQIFRFKKLETVRGDDSPGPAQASPQGPPPISPTLVRTDFARKTSDTFSGDGSPGPAQVSPPAFPPNSPELLRTELVREMPNTVSWAKTASMSDDSATLVKLKDEPKVSPDAKRNFAFGNIHRNSKDQRIDPLRPSTWTSQTISKVVNEKYCHYELLQGYCETKGRSCRAQHDVKLTREQKEIVWYLARRSRCWYAPYCSDPECIYGHGCQRRDCDVEDCDFPKELHSVKRE